MSALLALWLLAGCPSEAVAHVPEAKREGACAVLARDAPAPVNRAALDAIYREPELSRARIRNSGALEAMLARLEAWLDRLAGSRGVETYSVVTRWLVMGLGALAALWAIARLLERRRGPAAVKPAAPGAALVLEDPQLHFGRAERSLASSPREALREALLGLLSSLERARLARPGRVKTNRELVRELPGRGASAELAQAVAGALQWYDDTFYSLSEVQAEQARRFLDDARRLSAQAAAPA